MNFKQRLRFFLIGFVPGCIMLIFIVKKNGCTSPNELKMLELTHQSLSLSNKVICKLKCIGSSEQLFKVNLRHFKVNYDLSQVHQKPYGLYYLQAIDPENANCEFVIEDKDTISYIHDIKILKTISSPCHCDTVTN